MSILSLAGVHAFYGKSHILHGIDLDLTEGEVVALLGRNGAGKTTTIRTISGLLPPAEGSIRFEGRDIAGRRPDAIARAGIATVPESRDIFSTLTVRENLSLATRRAKEWSIERVLDTFPIIAPLMNRLGGQLSGGEQQMVAIARALLLEPRIIMLDEPSQGLAPVMVDRVVEVLNELKRTRISMLLVEQKLDIAVALADRIYVLDTGRIAHASGVAELRENPEIAERYLGVG
ncbi:MAG TPA: ABC transporter ATP-binding protein [Paracoccaceae bacterium]|nr:ABC transporter ATP-binding protein [Paracoccaceae bacterium]